MGALPPQGLPKRITMGGNAGIGYTGALTVYYGPYGGAIADATEADQTVEAPHSGRFKLIRQVATVNTYDDTLTLSARVNGATQSGGSVVTASTNGTFDSTSIVEFEKGDEINLILVVAAGTGFVGHHFLVEIEWDND